MSARLSDAEFAALTGSTSRSQKPSKYHAVPVIVTEAGEMLEAKAAAANGITGTRFASRAEGRRYLELRMLVLAGQASDLECQPVFPIHALDGSKVAVYRADFRYYDRQAKRAIVEDVKSKPTRTATYVLKRKLVEAEYGVEIRELG